MIYQLFILIILIFAIPIFYQIYKNNKAHKELKVSKNEITSLKEAHWTDTILNRKFNNDGNSKKKEAHGRYKDYPAMALFSKLHLWFSYFILFCGFTTLSSLIHMEWYPFIFPTIIGTFIIWFINKFIAEFSIIICDIAYYLKSINNKKPL